MNKKIYTIVAGSMLVGSLLGASTLVFAEDNQKNNDSNSPAQTQMMLQIGRNGETKLAGKLSAISGNTLTVASWGGNWMVDATNAKLMRRYGGTSSISEFQVGDTLTVSGQAATTGWAITARMIRDESIQVRSANFFGKITTVGTNTFTLTNDKQAALIVTTNVDTKFSFDGGTASSTAGLVVGNYATVYGVWDRTNSSVIAMTVKVRTADSLINIGLKSWLKGYENKDNNNGKGNGDHKSTTTPNQNENH